MDKAVLKHILEMAQVEGFDIVPRKAPEVELYPYQANAMTALDLCRFVMIKSARQMGKSTMIIERVRSYLNGFDEKTVLIVSPNIQMKKHMVEMIYHMIDSEYCTIDVKNKDQIRLTNKFGAMISIMFWNDQRGMDQRVRGMGIDALIFDEMTYMKYENMDMFLESVIPCLTARRNGEILMISSNRDLNNEHFSYFERLWRYNHNFAKIIWNIWEHPDFDTEKFEEQKRFLGKEATRSEYMVP